jgi:23S rRNA (uracil1939-C5)-methyltransferase
MGSKTLHTVLIEKLVPGGLGLGRLAGGMVVLVRYVLPGERVVVRERKRKKDFISATLNEILTPSPDRINPPCPLYGHCGGCDLQHATYNAQILLKKEILAGLRGIFSPTLKYPCTLPLPHQKNSDTGSAYVYRLMRKGNTVFSAQGLMFCKLFQNVCLPGTL